MQNHVTIKSVTVLTAGVIFFAALGGCQRGYRKYAEQLDQKVASGDYPSARELAVVKADKKAKDKVNRVIYNLEAARALQIDGDHEASIVYFTRVHEDVRPYLDEKAESKVTEGVATTAINQATATFRGTPVDRIMATTLNSINYMAIGDLAEARVQLNLARDWQEDAVRRYSDRIEQSDAELAKDAKKKGVEVDGILGEHYAELNDLRSYSDFQNPFASHLRGVFLISTASDFSDLDRARFELREVVGMEPQTAEMIAPDLNLIERGGSAEPMTWVYVMVGRGPWLEELAVFIPIPVGNVNFVSAAFPRIRFHEQPYGRVAVGTEGMSVEAVKLADLDSMVAAEFKGRLPRIIAQEILSATLKAAATYAAKESGGGVGQILGIVYQAASTSADTRSWRTLPQHVLLARLPTPPDGRILIDLAGYRTETFVEVGKSHIVVVTSPSPLVTPSIVLASLSAGRNQEEVVVEP